MTDIAIRVDNPCPAPAGCCAKLSRRIKRGEVGDTLNELME